MPYIDINDCKYFYTDEGDGNECILFSHGLLWNHKMFRPQIDHLKKDYRVVAYDHRGQGQTEVTQGGYDMEQLYRDALALIARLKLGNVHFAGLSMGGFVGLRLAARNSDVIKSLILMETSAKPEPNQLKYWVLNSIVKLFGTRPVAGRVMNIMFGQKFLNDSSSDALRAQLKEELINLDKSIVKAVEGVIRRKGVEDELKNISCPTLILIGTQDVATVPAKSEFMHRNILNSKLLDIDGAGHTSSLEEPDQVNKAISDFLAGITR